MRLLAKKLITLPMLVFLLSFFFGSTSYAYLEVNASIDYGCSRSYVQGTVSADDAPGAPVFEYTRVYMEFYEDGIFRGSKEDDGYPASGVQTEYCKHPSSSSYWMPYNIYRETDSGVGDDLGGNVYW
ncbi:hypothetical protein [Paenibacillus sanguinis]|uniref:hypothetical protein n=1 Tax=Paenibacillus sanguinis TaxID=225906 RepID=UPI0012B5C030|nr:hypothetical protein [Paenibacillus sanguinis]